MSHSGSLRRATATQSPPAARSRRTGTSRSTPVTPPPVSSSLVAPGPCPTWLSRAAAAAHPMAAAHIPAAAVGLVVTLRTLPPFQLVPLRLSLAPEALLVLSAVPLGSQAGARMGLTLPSLAQVFPSLLSAAAAERLLISPARPLRLVDLAVALVLHIRRGLPGPLGKGIAVATGRYIVAVRVVVEQARLAQMLPTTRMPSPLGVVMEALVPHRRLLGLPLPGAAAELAAQIKTTTSERAALGVAAMAGGASPPLRRERPTPGAAAEAATQTVAVLVPMPGRLADLG